MKNVVYSGAFDAVVAADGTEFPNGVAVSVSVEVAASLLLRDDFSEPKSAPVLKKPEEGKD